MLALVADAKDEMHSHYPLSDRDRFRAVVPRYHGDLSTAFNYTCLLVAFRDAVVGESWLTIIACISGIHSSMPFMFPGHRNMLLKRGILHRDISLGNIMFDPSGGDKDLGRLIDFDLAKCVEFRRGSEMGTWGDFRTVSPYFQVRVPRRHDSHKSSGNAHVPVL